MNTVRNNLQISYSSLSTASHYGYTHLKKFRNYVSSKFPEITALAKSSFSTLGTVISSVAHKSFSWIKVQGNHAFAKGAKMGYSVAQKAVPFVNMAKIKLSENKDLVFVGVVVSVALYVLYSFWKNRPQQPVVDIQSTLNVSKLSISVPKEMHGIPDVTMTFCIDNSDSMQQEGHSKDVTRLDDVKNAMANMLKNAQKKVDEGKAIIKIAVVAFNDETRVLVEPIAITPLGNTAQKIIETIQKVQHRGGTNICQGLDESTVRLERMSKNNSKSAHTLVLITDGEDEGIEAVIQPIHKRLIALKADFFAIGVGKLHDRAALKKITQRDLVKGTYIDTTSGLDTIDSAITRIYDEALSTFQQMELTCPTLKGGQWSVQDKTPIVKDEIATYDLGALVEGDVRNLKVTIQGAQLREPIDLRSVKFFLRFIDPKGRKGQQVIHWQANTIIDPTLLRF